MPRKMKPATDVHLPLSLLVKVGTALTYLRDFHSPGGNANDMHAGVALLEDPEVRGWLAQMARAKHIPESRHAKPLQATSATRSNYTRG